MKKKTKQKQKNLLPSLSLCSDSACMKKTAQGGGGGGATIK